MISGAISFAVNEVNAGPLQKLGHELAFVIAETQGVEATSILQTAALWTDKIHGYIGPQETCVHEGRMAAAFNIPMISYVSYIHMPYQVLLQGMPMLFPTRSGCETGRALGWDVHHK